MASPTDFKVKNGLQVQGGDVNLGGGTTAGVIQVDASASGVGLDLTISAGESSASSNAGGSINLATAVEEGTPTNKIVIGPTGVTTLTAGSNLDIGPYTVTGTRFISDIPTGTSPLAVTSTTVVANLNASSLGGATMAAPGAIGGGTPAAGTFTALAATSGDFGNGAIANVGDIDADSISVADAANGLQIQFGGVTTTNKITLTDNLAEALTIEQGGNDYMKFVTSDSSEQIVFGKNSTFASTTIASLGTVSAATSITSTAFVGAIDGILGGSTPAAASVTTLSASSTGAIAGAVSLGAASAASTVTQVSSNAGVNGKTMTITAGSPTGDSGTNDRTGGNLLLQGGQGTGTGVGGSIIFKSAGAGGSTGNALNNLDDTLLTLASTGTATFAGAVSGITTLGTSGAVEVGADGTGADVKFHSGTAGDNMLWDASAANLVLEGTNSQTVLEVTDGNVEIKDGSLVVEDSITSKDSVVTDVVSELTSTGGVLVDSVLLKDSAVYPGGSTTNKGKLYDDATNTYLTHTATNANVNLVATGNGNVLIDNLILYGDTIYNSSANLKLEGYGNGGVNISGAAGQYATVAGTGMDVQNNTAGGYDIGLQVNAAASSTSKYAEVRIKVDSESPFETDATSAALVLRNSHTNASGSNAVFYDFGTTSTGATWGTGTQGGTPAIFQIGYNTGTSYDDTKNRASNPTGANSSVAEFRKPTTVKQTMDTLTLVNTARAADMDGTGTAIAFDQWYDHASNSTLDARADAGRITVKTETDWTEVAGTHDAKMVFAVAKDNTVTDSLTLNSDGTVGFRNYTFPVADSTDSSYVLKSNTSGVLAWAADTGGGVASSVAADDIATGNAAVNIVTTVGNITLDAQATDSDIIFIVDDNASAVTALTLDGGDAGNATFVNKISAVELDISGDIDVDGTTNLDNTDIDGTLTVDGSAVDINATTTCAIDNSNTTNGLTLNTVTSGSPISIGHTTSETTVNHNLTVTGNLTVSGTTTTVESTTVSIEDPIFQLGESGADDNLDRGLKMLYNNSGAKSAFLGMDDTNQKLLWIPDATDSSNTFSGTAGTIVANLDGTVNTATQGSITTAANLTTVGALNAGSITSGFTSIDVGAGAISTTGTLTGGAIVGTGLSMDSTVLMDYYKSGSLTATTAVTMFDIVSATYSAFKVLVSVFKNADPWDRSVAEYLITTRGDDGPTTNSDDLFMTEYAIVETGGAALATVTAVKDGTATKIKVAPASTTSTYVRAQITQFVI